MKPYVLSDKKLKGKALDEALEERKGFQEQRRSEHLGIREAAKKYGIQASDLLAFEYGYDLCGHEEWIDDIGGIPSKFVFKKCKKCGMPDSESLEKISEKNLKRTYRAFRMATRKRNSKEC